MREKMERVKHATEKKMWKVRAVLADRSGENFIDSAIKILMAVVIGALLLAGLYALFSENVGIYAQGKNICHIGWNCWKARC